MNGHINVNSQGSRCDGSILGSEQPRPKNPFVQRLNLSTLDKIQVMVMSVFVCPLRVLLVTFMNLFADIFARLALCCIDKCKLQTEPLSGWRTFFRPICIFFSRMMYLCAGFHWITVRGEKVGSDVAPIIVAGPHSTFFDALFVPYLGLITVVAKAGTENIPLIGAVTRYTQPILVHRDDPDSRANTVREIQRRAATNGKWPQVIIFPEGTCTNASCLINFKPGAFIPAVPVQPLCIRYRNRMNTTTWTWKGPSALKVYWLTLANFNTKIEIEFLPVYTPNEEEKKDPALFARNVRAVMARALGIPAEDYGHDDIMAMIHSIELPIAEELTHINSLVRALNISAEELRSLLTRLSGGTRLTEEETEPLESEREDSDAEELDLCRVSYKQFVSMLGITPESESACKLYSYYCKDVSTHIDMRPLVVHMSMLTRSYSIPEMFKFAFQVYDKESKGFLGTEQFASLIQAVGLDEQKFSREHISYDDFLSEAKSRADCSGWFKSTPPRRERGYQKNDCAAAAADREKSD